MRCVYAERVKEVYQEGMRCVYAERAKEVYQEGVRSVFPLSELKKCTRRV